MSTVTKKYCNNAWPDLPLYDMNPKTPPHTRITACHAAMFSTLHVFFSSTLAFFAFIELVVFSQSQKPVWECRQRWPCPAEWH